MDNDSIIETYLKDWDYSEVEKALNVARAEGAREFAKWLEDTYWIELSISNDVCHNYDCDEIIKEYEKYKKEQSK